MARPVAGFDSRPAGERQLIASIGAHTRWAKTPSPDARRSALAPANAARRSQWEKEADPDGVLSPAELAVAVEHVRKRHFRRMALASAEKRRGKRSPKKPSSRERRPAEGAGADAA